MLIAVTGSSGTIGKELIKTIKNRNHNFLQMNRGDLDINNKNEVINFLNLNKPDAIIHLAKADKNYTRVLLEWSKKNNTKFIFTSTYKVFSGKKLDSPYQVYDRPDGTDEFAQYKIELEDLVFDVYPESYIARLAWQIGKKPGGYNMLSFIKDQIDKRGIIHASKNLYLSAMFLEDTTNALIDLIESYMPGLYHLESNDGFSFYDIIYFLKHTLGHEWIILGDNKKFSKNDLMENNKIKVTTFTELGMKHHK